MNKLKEFKFYNSKEGIGSDDPNYLKKRISQAPTMYDFRYMHFGYKMSFIKGSDEVEAKEDSNRKKTTKMQVLFDYNDLDKSYAIRELTLSDDYLHRYSE